MWIWALDWDLGYMHTIHKIRYTNRHTTYAPTYEYGTYISILESSFSRITQLHTRWKHHHRYWNRRSLDIDVDGFIDNQHTDDYDIDVCESAA